VDAAVLSRGRSERVAHQALEADVSAPGRLEAMGPLGLRPLQRVLRLDGLVDLLDRLCRRLAEDALEQGVGPGLTGVRGDEVDQALDGAPLVGVGGLLLQRGGQLRARQDGRHGGAPDAELPIHLLERALPPGDRLARAGGRVVDRAHRVQEPRERLLGRGLVHGKEHLGHAGLPRDLSAANAETSKHPEFNVHGSSLVTGVPEEPLRALRNAVPAWVAPVARARRGRRAPPPSALEEGRPGATVPEPGSFRSVDLSHCSADLGHRAGARELPSRSFELPSRSFELPSRSFELPSRSFGLPSRSFELPSRSFEPPSRSFEPPSRSFEPPSRSFVPPSRSFVPPSRRSEPPSRSFVPPSRRSEPPSRSFVPPSRRSEPPSGRSEPPSGRSEPPSGRSEPAVREV